MYNIQYKLKGMYEHHHTLSNVEAFWIEGEELIIVQVRKGKTFRTSLSLYEIDYVNFEEELTRKEVKELELENKLYKLRDELISFSEKNENNKNWWCRNLDDKGKWVINDNHPMARYHQGAKNGLDLAIAKLNEILGIYENIEKGGNEE